jgi:DNA-binding response OmpR family regulator
VRVLLAADADWLVDDLVAALGGPDVSFTVCTEGREVSRLVTERAARDEPFDVVIADLQIGSMGGMAVTLALRLDESAGSVPHVQVVMLLDRVADVHLARRSGADGWLVKPLDPLRLDRAVSTVLAGGRYREGLDGVDVVAAGAAPVATAEGEVVATDASE